MFTSSVFQLMRTYIKVFMKKSVRIILERFISVVFSVLSMADVKKKLQEGWIHVLVTFEIIGKPKDHVVKALKDFLVAIKKDKRFEFLEEHVEPAVEADSGFFSTFAEVDMVAKDFESLTFLAFNFTPASIEVIEPASFKLSSRELQNWLNDMLSSLHAVSFQLKQQKTHLEHLKIQLQGLIENTIIMSLARGAKKLPELSKDTTLTEDTLKQLLPKIKESKKIVEKKGVYSLA